MQGCAEGLWGSTRGWRDLPLLCSGCSTAQLWGVLLVVAGVCLSAWPANGASPLAGIDPSECAAAGGEACRAGRAGRGAFLACCSPGPWLR